MFLQNGCRRPVWMSENHFPSHFWPFQINTQLFFLEICDKMAEPFWMSEIHFRSHFWPFQIDTQLYFFRDFFTKWLSSAILDVRNSLSIAFLAISDRSAIFDFRNSLSIAILAISDRYRILFSSGHFGCPKITLDRISGYFRSIRSFFCC